MQREYIHGAVVSLSEKNHNEYSNIAGLMTSNEYNNNNNATDDGDDNKNQPKILNGTNSLFVIVVYLYQRIHIELMAFQTRIAHTHAHTHTADTNIHT